MKTGMVSNQLVRMEWASGDPTPWAKLRGCAAAEERATIWARRTTWRTPSKSRAI